MRIPVGVAGAGAARLGALFSDIVQRGIGSETGRWQGSRHKPGMDREGCTGGAFDGTG